MAGTEGVAPALMAQLWNSMLRGAAYPAPFAAWWVQFHLDHPGPLGLLNPALFTTRTLAAFAAASTTLGTIANSGLLTIGPVSNNELWKFFTVKTLSAGGIFIVSGQVNGGVGASVTAGTSPTIAVGELVASGAVAG